MDLTFFLFIGAVFVVMSLVRWWWWARPANAASSAHAFARKVDLALADRTEEVVTVAPGPPRASGCRSAAFSVGSRLRRSLPW